MRGVVSTGSGPKAQDRICATVVSTGVTFGSGTCFSACLKSLDVGAVGVQWQMSVAPHDIMHERAKIARRDGSRCRGFDTATQITEIRHVVRDARYDTRGCLENVTCV